VFLTIILLVSQMLNTMKRASLKNVERLPYVLLSSKLLSVGVDTLEDITF
jgi:hypothetical protein